MLCALHAMLPESQQCHRRARTSYRLADLVTADRRTAASLAACAALCANRASCNSLSYRWSGVTIYSNIRGGSGPVTAILSPPGSWLLTFAARKQSMRSQLILTMEYSDSSPAL